MSSSDLFGYNTTLNDGCSSDCKTENGYSWVVNPPNTFSTWIAICGDELVVGSEQWDDKNTTPNDGCSSDCKTDTTETGMKEDGRVIVIMDREHTNYEGQSLKNTNLKMKTRTSASDTTKPKLATLLWKLTY